MTDSCALHKMLLVVFLHHRALLSLPQSSYSTNTSSSRASLNCLSQCDTECPAMACVAVYCSRELFPIPVYVVYGSTLRYRACWFTIWVWFHRSKAQVLLGARAQWFTPPTWPHVHLQTLPVYAKVTGSPYISSEN